MSRRIRTLRPVSSSTSRSAVSSISSPLSGVPFGKTQVASAWRPARTTSRLPSRWRTTTPPAATALRTRDRRRARMLGIECPLNLRCPETRSRLVASLAGKAAPRSALTLSGCEKRSLKESGVVDDEREIAVEEFGRTPRQHHARQEDLEVLHDRRDLGVDRELERDELFLAADLDLGGGNRVVHTVVDVK